jgi:hypothetical protein
MNIEKYRIFEIELLYEHINMESIDRSWLGRYYHLIYLSRFFAVAVFIFNF